MKPKKILDYVESDGTRWIDTRFYMWHDAHNEHSFGYVIINYFCATNVDVVNYRDNPSDMPIGLGVKHHARVSFTAARQTAEMDGTRIYTGTNSATIDIGVHLYLFACNYGGAQYCSSARCHGLKIWQTDYDDVYRLVRDFAPPVCEERVRRAFGPEIWYTIACSNG